MLMGIDGIEDWEQRLDRQDAFWDRAILDRPVCVMTLARKPPVTPWPEWRAYPTHRDRWMDTVALVEQAVASAKNTLHLGDALPKAWPNLGPEVFSAFFGQEMEYTETTSWSVPVIENWAQTEHIRFSENNKYWKKLEEMTDELLDAGRGLYYTGLTDLHPGGDAVAAFRDPARLNTDLLVEPDAVKSMLEKTAAVYHDVMEYYQNKLTKAEQATTCWAGIVSRKRWYVPSNDFSCMISEPMFREFFLPGIREECQALEASIYHLDGPDALRHLDALLEIPELNAIQWVYGAGRGRASDWIPVYQRCQQAGKGIQLWADLDELNILTEHLRPEGVWMGVHVNTVAESDAVLDQMARWAAHKR